MSIFDRLRKQPVQMPIWADKQLWAGVAAELRATAPNGTVSTTSSGRISRSGWGGRAPNDTDDTGKCISRNRGREDVKSIATIMGDDSICYEINVTGKSATVHIVQETPGLRLWDGPQEIVRVEGAVPQPYRRAPVRYPATISPHADPQAVSDLVSALLPDAQPVSDEEIAEVEAQWGVTLTQEVRALYEAAASGDLIKHIPLPTDTDDDVVEEDDAGYYMHITPLADKNRQYPGGFPYPWCYSATEIFLDPHGRVQNLGYSPGWIQIGDDWGGNLFLVDLIPGPNGNVGQVLFSDHEQCGGADWVANSLAEFFALDNRYPTEQLNSDWRDQGVRGKYRLRVGGDCTLDELSDTTEVLIINGTGMTDLKPILGHPQLRSVKITANVTSLEVLATLPSLEWLSMSYADWTTLLDMDAFPPTLMAAGFPDADHLEPAMAVVNRIRTAWGQDPCPVLTVDIPDSLIRQATT